MPDLPRCAMVELFGSDGTLTYRPVESPPCGARLDIDERNVHLVCDQLPSHVADDTKHRSVIDAATGYVLWWCEDDCAHRCGHWLANDLKTIREAIERGSNER